MDYGLLDVNQNDLTLDDHNIKFVGATSDMTVIDIGDNLDQDGCPKYKVGDMLRLNPNYMAVARLLHSKFIDCKYVK